ncbi:MAG: hypothetical protein GY893_13410 [bacterium]|nr:hypothetical protein [bacterium]
MSNGWIKFDDVKTDKFLIFLIFNILEPFNYRRCVFPLVELGSFNYLPIDSVEDFFADFTDLGLGGIDESAGWIYASSTVSRNTDIQTS